MNENQNAFVVTGDSISTSSLNSDHVRQLGEVVKATGIPMSKMLNRAISQWLDIEAPLYVEYARRNA
jgi:hypothetical protein